MPPPPPPKRGGGGALIAALVGGGVVVLLIIGVVVFVLTSGGDGKTPEQKLNSAADTMAAARAVGLKGSFGGGADTLNGELSVTKGGRATGPVTWNSDNLTLLSADGKLFVKAGAAYWRRQISASETPYYLGTGDQWGRLSADKLDIDFKAELTPVALAGKLRSAAASKVKPIKTTWQGKKALKFSTFSSTLYITDADEAELLRYEATTPRVSLDVTPKSAGQASTLLSDMRTNMGELKDSFDASARPTVDEWKKGGCNGNSGCTVEAKIRPPFGAQTPVTIDVRFRLTAGTLSGRDLGNCTSRITITGTTSQWASCRVSSSAWSSWAKSTGGTYYKHADYKVIGATASEVQALQSGLDSE
ncbi:hypothetical protein E1298_46710 [Actinomadura rubrisoli]|uniref:Uncharacterized protein n=2 Tax=Actinomadura rubrisoli TaxID=2530368 RepID=A0A4R4ZME9_9ACTN|nr:hypothetical protein E1298_46710 [Actinomadura rubrisoli]